MAEQCAMIIGYLVPHRCDHVALGACGRCGRHYCDDHLAVTAEGLLCAACQQGLISRWPSRPLSRPTIPTICWSSAD